MPTKNKGLKEIAYQELLKKIIYCEYAPGEILNESKIAEDFNLSRTPVREAVSRLQMDGYVKVLPKKGIRVSDVTLDDALQIFQARIEIEPLTLKMAIPYISTEELLDFKNQFEHSSDIPSSTDLDTKMHLYLIDRCQNLYLIDVMHKVFQDNTRVVIATKQNEAKIHDAKEEHLQILNSLINKDDPNYCAELMRKHILTCRKAALNYFTSSNFKYLITKTSHFGNAC